MHVPAYWPMVAGVQPIEKRGVVEEVKNVIAIESIVIIVSDDIDIEELVELAIDIPDIVLVADIDMAMESVELAIDMPDIVLVGDTDMTIELDELAIDISIVG